MGHNCTSEIAPFVCHGVCSGEYYGEYYGADEDNDEDNKLNELQQLILTSEQGGGIFRGWKQDCYPNMERFGKRELLSILWIRKGDLKVCAINEDKASNCGYYDTAIAANDKASLQAFLDDFADCVKRSLVEEVDIIQEWK